MTSEADGEQVSELVGTSLNHLPFIVGVGASAGGLEALTVMLESVSGLTNLAIVIVQHLSADYKSMMPELLARHTEMEVVTARDGVTPLADTVYIIEPDTVLTFESGQLCVQPAHKVQGRLFLPINTFFESLARERRDNCAVVVLSGTGSDGASGLRAAKACGAVTICQQPESARFDGMPRSAMATGAVDLVLAPDHVLQQVMQMRQEGQSQYFSAASGHGEVSISRILAALRAHTSIDFNFYKPATVLRRVERRMRHLGLDDMREYADRLYQDAVEAQTLRHELLIGVTRFLRDAGAIDALRNTAIPRLASVAQDHTLRIWVAGCSTGEEAYSLAMLLQEALDGLSTHQGFKLFATDVDPAAIERASAGEFSKEVAEQLPARLRERYFTERGDDYVVIKPLREKLLFSKHDLIQDPPFSHLDMVSCRNLLIYLKPAVQERVLRLLSAAINDGGILWLGASEVVGESTEHFETLDSRWRVYVARANRQPSAIVPLPGKTSLALEPLPRRPKIDPVRVLLEMLQQRYVPPCLVIDLNFRVLYRFGELDALLKFPTGPVTLDARSVLPDELSVLVTALVNKARNGADVVYRELSIETERGVQRFDLRAHGLTLPEQGSLVVLLFEGLREGVKTPQRLSSEKVDAETRDRITLLERELRQTRESLQATVEEVESSNEELQATNEELVAANEELQSTNEELQSVNEELHTVNAEYSEKLNELTLVNQDMDRFFASMDVGILLLDDRLTIRRFNQTATQYFNLLPQDAGRPLIHFAHRMRYSALLEDCAQALRSPQVPIRRQVTTLDDRTVQVQLRGHDSNSAATGNGRTLVVTITDTTSALGTQQQLSRLATALEHSPAMVAFMDSSDKVIHANAAFIDGAPQPPQGLIGTPLPQLLHPSERERIRDALARTRTGVRWRGVMRALSADGERFELVHLVPATLNDPSVIWIAEPLATHFVPYDVDRRADEPAALGSPCYCLWSELDGQRATDAHVLDLLELSSDAEFALDHPESFSSAEDAKVLRTLITHPDVRGDRGFRFPAVRAAPTRMIQVRLCRLEHEPARILLEFAETPGAAPGFRA